jgi:hypothetical protein
MRSSSCLIPVPFKILDTTANMWSHLLSHDVGGEDIGTQHLLTNRLPRSLSTLVFHARDNIAPAETNLLYVAQMQDLLENHSERLPNVRQVSLSLGP